MKRTPVLTTALLAAATAAAAGPDEIRVPRGSRAIPDSYIVVLKAEAAGWAHAPAASGLTVSQVAVDLAARFGGQVTQSYQRALRGFALRMPQARARALARDPRVEYVEQDAEVWAVDTQPGATWGLDRIDQRDLPLDGSYTYDSTAGAVHAYIIDTGIRTTHSDFGGRASVGTDAIGDGQNGNDCNGHGTHVAGTVGGGAWGVAKAVRLYAVRVLNCQGSGSISQVVAGVDWVTANHASPAVANMSLGGGASSALDTAVDNSIAAGVTYAIAAGNSNANACNSSPARVPAAITVGATDSADSRASFSNFGSCLDTFAPGVNITSAWNTSDTATNTISGTSMAAPHVAGVAALYLAGNAGASPQQVRDALVATATPNKVGSPGTGSPNLLLYSRQGGGGTDDPPVASFTFTCSGLTCSFNGGGSSDDHGISGHAWNFGDGTTGSGASTSRTYAAGGSYSVTLTVTDTAGQTDSETKTVTVSAAPCPGTQYGGFLSGTGDYDYQPNGGYYYSGATGTHRGCLRGPSGQDFDLYLYKWQTFLGLFGYWSLVASAEGLTAAENINYLGSPGYYYWEVYSYRGSGNYSFWLQRP